MKRLLSLIASAILVGCTEKPSQVASRNHDSLLEIYAESTSQPDTEYEKNLIEFNLTKATELDINYIANLYYIEDESRYDEPPQSLETMYESLQVKGKKTFFAIRESLRSVPRPTRP